MITRIFRVKIRAELREKFEPLFQSVSVASVENAKGFISVQIGKPTSWAPDEYIMISVWDSEDSLREFAGERWNEAYIPDGMEKFVDACWVHHYVSF